MAACIREILRNLALLGLLACAIYEALVNGFTLVFISLMTLIIFNRVEEIYTTLKTIREDL